MSFEPVRHGAKGTAELLAQFGLHPDKSLGQHFLVDPNQIDRIVRLARVKPGDHVVEVGPGVTTLEVGDHVVLGFIPSCGRCPSCAKGQQNLCDMGAVLLAGRQISDMTARHHRADGSDLGIMCCIGTFSEVTVVNEASCIKIEKDVPLDRACLLGCGVVTGWGSAVYAGQVSAGDVVAVVGVGGIGANAIQGATHTAASMEEAMEPMAAASWGTMANAVIMTMGVGSGELLAGGLALAAKRGKVVVTNIHPAMEMTANISLLDLTLMEKQVVGSLFGSGNPRADIPKLLGLYREGQLDLDGLVTTEYDLDGVNDGYDDMRAGKNVRGVMIYS